MPAASNNELIGVLGIAAVIGVILWYSQTPNILSPRPLNSVVGVKPPPPIVVKPVQWEVGGVGPGWGSGRWLGEGDFKHFGRMDHPFNDRPSHSGHPMYMPDLPQAHPVDPGRGGFSGPGSSIGTRGSVGSHGGSHGGGHGGSHGGSHGGGHEGYMMPPMGGAMGPTRY